MPTARAAECFIVATVLSLGSARPAHAQLEAGNWVRKAVASMPAMTIKIEACCGSGRRLTYVTKAADTTVTLVLETRLDGTEATVTANGKPTGETMAFKRVDAHHVTNILKMNGKQFATSKATLSEDGKTLTVVTENVSTVSGPAGTQTEVFVKQ